MKTMSYLMTCILILIGCQKEKIVIKEVEVEKVHNWKAHSKFQFKEALTMNSYSTQDSLFILSYFSFSTITLDSTQNADSLQEGDASHYTFVWTNNQFNRKIPISADFYIMYSFDGYLGFVPTKNPGYPYSSFYLDLAEMDREFTDFEFPSFYYGECMSINNNNQAIIPYFINNTNVDLKVAMIDVTTSLEDGNNVILDTLKTKIISLPDSISYALIYLCSIKQNFYLTTSNEVFRINPEGEVKSVLNSRLYDIFEKSDTLYGIGNPKMYYSSTQGLTWNEIGDIPFDFVRLNYAKIDNHIIGYYNAQLFEVFPRTDGLSLVELDNDGLAGKTITSINKLHDNIYVTTLSGVYYKSYSELFNAKE